MDLNDMLYVPLQEADLTLLADWMTDPEVARWYAGPEELPNIRAHLADPRVTPLLAHGPGGPFAYIQHYAIDGFDDHPLAALPPGAHGIDCFIGPGAARGRGLGTLLVDGLCRQLFAKGVPAVGIDPEPDNARAIACYKRAGFGLLRQTKEATLLVRWPD